MVRTFGRRRFVSLLGASGGIAVMEPLGRGDDEPQPADGQDLVFDTGGTGGTYYPLANEFKTIIEAHAPHEILVRATGASVENVGNLARESADFALIQNDVAYFAYRGTGLEEFADSPIDSLRGVASLYPETIHVLTRSAAGYEAVADLEGAVVNTGDVGSGTRVNARQILEMAEVDAFEELNTDFSTAVNQLQDGDVDAAFVVGGWPVEAVEDLAAIADVDVLEVDGDLRDELLAEVEFFAEDVIPGGTYDGIDADVETISVQAMLTTHEAVEEDLVEEITSAIFGHTDDLTIKTEFIDVDSALEGMSIPLHPGAEAYFEGHEDVDLEGVPATSSE
ncbi:TAXI family TRAP transporter solute-binding subunit [Natrialbaceae archaeon A-gly3]